MQTGCRMRSSRPLQGLRGEARQEHSLDACRPKAAWRSRDRRRDSEPEESIEPLPNWICVLYSPVVPPYQDGVLISSVCSEIARPPQSCSLHAHPATGPGLRSSGGILLRGYAFRSSIIEKKSCCCREPPMLLFQARIS